jgi:hypothetical protein
MFKHYQYILKKYEKYTIINSTCYNKLVLFNYIIKTKNNENKCIKLKKIIMT